MPIFHDLLIMEIERIGDQPGKILVYDRLQIVYPLDMIR